MQNLAALGRTTLKTDGLQASTGTGDSMGYPSCSDVRTVQRTIARLAWVRDVLSKAAVA